MSHTPNLRSRATQAEILTAFAERLRTVEEFAGTVTAVTDQPIPVAFAPQGERAVTVSPGAGGFPENAWTGGHHATATENGSIIISIYVKAVKDRPGSRPVGVSDLAELKRKALKVLAVETPASGASSPPWEPVAALGRPLLRDIPVPVRCSQPGDVEGNKTWVGMQITYAVTWDWDLYSE